MSHVLVAPDKFKGTLGAADVAGHIATGLRQARPSLPVVTLPVADGGDGTAEAAIAAGFDRVTARVAGPAGSKGSGRYVWRKWGYGNTYATRTVDATLGMSGDTAVVELAEASGLRLMDELAPLTATSLGTGQLIAEAVRRGARRIVLGLGGSACTDGGAGMIQGLGGRLLDRHGRDLPPGGAALRDLHSIDLTDLIRPEELVVASDVDNPLLGPSGAAAVYGPQKGATPADVKILETGLERWADAVEAAQTVQSSADRDAGEQETRDRGADVRSARDMPGAGAAGGVGFAAIALLGAHVEPGIELLLDLLGFAGHLRGASLVITGEGSLDEQTLRGKAPAGVAAAVTGGVPVVAVCGRNTLSTAQLNSAGFSAAYALTDIEPDPARCMAEPGALLERLAEKVAADWLR